MSDLPTRPRRYDEKEVSRLLERASELQRSQPAVADPSGLTLAELEEIALEAGLDPEYLRRAAHELDRPEVAGGGVGASLAGAPTRVLLERTLPVEVSPAVFDQLVPIIQIAADAPGQASQVGRSLTWHSQNPSNPRTLQILVSIQDGHTAIRIDERYGGWAGALFGGVMGGVGGGVGIGVGGTLGGFLGSTALAIGFPAAVLAGSYALCRSIYRRFVTRRIERLQELMDRMEAELLSAADASPPPLPPSPSP